MSMEPGNSAMERLQDTADSIAVGLRRRRWMRRIRVLLFSTAIATLVGEVGLRLNGYREKTFEAHIGQHNRRWVELVRGGVLATLDDPRLRYGLAPGADCEVDGWRFRINEDGFRGAKLERQKPADERRIVCLGDSYAFGMWCAEDETLVAQLARLATEREEERGSSVRWQSVNLGVPGYHAGQQLVRFRELGLAYDPDVVVLYFNTNDIEDLGFFYDEDLGLYRDFLPLPVRLKRWLWNSDLYCLIARSLKEGIENRPFAYLDPEVPYAHTRTDNRNATVQALRDLAVECKEADVPLFVVVQPEWSWSTDVRSSSWPVLPLVRWSNSILEELEIPHLSLLGLLRNYADGEDRFPEPPTEGFLSERYIADERVQAYFAGDAVDPEEVRDFHLLGSGYQHIAELVYARLQQAGHVP